MFVFLIEAFHIYHAKVTFCNIVDMFPPDHWNAKRRCLSFPWDHDLKVSTQLVQTLCGTHALSWSRNL